MDLTQVLKNISIIQLFKKNLFSTFSSADIERKLGLSHHPMFRRLKVLEKNNILIKKDRGYCLNMQNPMVFELMHFLENIQKIENEKK